MSQDLMSLIQQAGFTGQAANTMYAIVMAESGGDTSAHNTNANTGDNSYGLAQINMLGSLGPSRLAAYHLSSNDDLFDPLTNLKVAYALSNGGKDFTPWSTYVRGDYKQYLGQTGAVVSQTGSGGTGSSGGTAGAPNMTEADYEAALGNLSGLLTSVPELADLLKKAVTGDGTGGPWTTDTFMQHVEQSTWWRTHSDDARRVVGLQLADPAQYKQELTQYVGHINQLAHTLGMNLTTGQTLDIAKRAMTGGLTGDQGWLQTQIAGVQNFLHTSNLDSLNGQEAQVANQLSQLAGEYGQSWGANQFAYRAQQILAGKTTIDTYQNLMKQQAKSMFPGLASQIDAGMTVKDLASPYVQAMSNILELDPSAIQLTDPLVKRALQGTQGVSDGKASTPTAMPVWQFEQQLRSDPRWAQTQNAKDTISSALVKVGADFGFGPNG